MKANELRIFNLIDRGDYICKVLGIDETGLIIEPINYKGERFVIQELSPIPLTEEWLLKFGFNKDYDWYYKLKYPHQINVSLKFNKSTIGMGEEYDIEIKYVHQLQNLYFALTGEELTTTTE